MGLMGSTECRIQEKRLGRIDRLVIPDEFNRFINDILGDMLPFFRALGRIDGMVVIVELGVKLVRFAIQEPIVPVKATL